jgi:hypothetical protein
MAKATNTPKAPATTQAAGPSTTNNLLQQVYTLGKPYNVRPNTAQNNAASWQAITAALQANGGTATRAQLLAAMQPLNHAPMVGYAIRRGWLAPAQ